MPLPKCLELLVPPPLVALFAAGLMYLLDALLAIGHFSFVQQQDVAIAIAILGGMLLLWALAAFINARTTVNPLKPYYASQLLTDGVFAFSRNPVYLADTVLLVAWLVWLGNLLAAPAVLLFMAYITAFQIIPEERILLKMFGDRYRDYCRKTRRWL